MDLNPAKPAWHPIRSLESRQRSTTLNTTTEPTFVSPTIKLSRLTGLFNKVLTSETSSLDDLIDDMLRKDPRLLCRLNFKNPQVKKKVRKLLDDGIIKLADLMYEPRDTVVVRQAPRVAKRTAKRNQTQRIRIQTGKPARAKKMVSVSANCDAWLDELDRVWESAETEKNKSESGIFEAILS